MKIFLADNDVDFLDTRAEFLGREGYQVIKALTLADAKKYLQEEWVPLAILDIRLENDDDEKDISGIMLLKADFMHSISKIVLTNFPDVSLIRELVLAGQTGKSITLNVIAKYEDPAVLIQAVREAFAEHVKINWNLHIEWKARDAFALVNLIESGLERERLLNRAEEMEDLFRRLFYEKEHIRIERML
jgi:DNA-binding NtrC family response regulator